MPIADGYVEEIFGKITGAVNAVIRGALAVALAQGVVAGVGFMVFGVPNPIFLGLLTVIGSLLPIVGAAIVTVPAIIYLAVTGTMLGTVGLALWSVLLVGLVDNFLRPLLMKRDMNIHPLFILLSVLGGLNLFGPIGFLLGPVILSLFAALLELYPKVMLDTHAK